MQPSRRLCICASLAALLSPLFPSRALADTLTISSTPPGASVDIDGKLCGPTPYRIDYPGGYFHKPHTVFAARLEHALVLKISKDGFAAQQITLTEGPFDWISATGKHHGTYYLLKSDRFDLKLDPLPPGIASINSVGREGPLPPARASESARTAPAVTDKDSSKESAVRDIGTVQIESDPPGAEIYIDGQFAGQTPATIRLPSGTHHVEVKSQGKQDWLRDLEVWKESQLTLHPVLAPPVPSAKSPDQK
jgi:hypothetical protein